MASAVVSPTIPAKKNGKNPTKDRGLWQHEDGRWGIRYSDENGRRHSEIVGTKTQARDLLSRRKSDIVEGRYFPERIKRRTRSRITVADIVQTYLRHTQGTPNYSHHERFTRVWTEEIGTVPIDTLQPKDIEAYRLKRLEAACKVTTSKNGAKKTVGKPRTVSKATVNREVAFLKAAFNLAIRDELVTTNPVAKVKQFQENNARVRYLTEGENEGEGEEAELRAVMKPEDFALVEFAFLSGLRQAEQFNAEWENIDLPNRVITVPRSKNGEKRHVPISDKLNKLLRGLPSRGNSRWVFPSKTGETPMNAQNFYHRVFQPALKEAGIKGFVWHDLRHTFASRLVMKGIDLNTVRELLGHKTLEMTRRYAHLAPSHLKQAVNVL